MAPKKDDENKRPIIVKKVKKVAGGHHGGAWKVAYADFVTAMMAFFLLLWLLSTSSKATLDGIAEFFTPTVGIRGAQGIGFKGGVSATPGTSKAVTSNPGVVSGSNPTGVAPESTPNTAPIESNQDDNLFKQGATALHQAFTADQASAQYSDNISVEQTPDGLKIDMIDSDKYAMFDANSPNLTPHGEAVLSRMAGIIKKMPNYITITGHTDGSPVEAGKPGYTNWELSVDRANAARRYLVKAGIEPERAVKVVGMADKELLVPTEPRNPRNRRISIVLLKGSHLLIPPDTAKP
ncbi:MAG: flagellar motor protein MotB [Alphaproteobacteria bacterium]